jgi:hypothetical protein
VAAAGAAKRGGLGHVHPHGMPGSPIAPMSPRSLSCGWDVINELEWEGDERLVPHAVRQRASTTAAAIGSL